MLRPATRWGTMPYLDLKALGRTPLKTEPYDYLVVPGFVRADQFRSVVADYPQVPGPGSHPLSELRIDGHFRGLLDEMNGPEFRHAVEDKFGIDLLSRPTMFTVRGECRASDGKIHTDSTTKLVTVLLYMNDKWDKDGGRLRILRNGSDLDDYAEEVPPHGGTLLMFRRSDNSWHGHQPFDGPRRAIQMNWVTDKAVVAREQSRHAISSTIKKLNPFRKAS
jgi:SM-20-related protein